MHLLSSSGYILCPYLMPLACTVLIPGSFTLIKEHQSPPILRVLIPQACMLGMLTPLSFVLLFGRLPAHKVRPPTPTLLCHPINAHSLSTLTPHPRLSLCFPLRPFLLSRLKMKLFSAATLLLLLVLTSSYLHGSMAADSGKHLYPSPCQDPRNVSSRWH